MYRVRAGVMHEFLTMAHEPLMEHAGSIGRDESRLASNLLIVRQWLQRHTEPSGPKAIAELVYGSWITWADKDAQNQGAFKIGWRRKGKFLIPPGTRINLKTGKTKLVRQDAAMAAFARAVHLGRNLGRVAHQVDEYGTWDPSLYDECFNADWNTTMGRHGSGHHRAAVDFDPMA